MRCGVLGELVVVEGARTIRVGRSTRAVVLAALLCHAGRPLAVAELVDLVWGDAPATAATMVHGAVARLRRELPPGLIGTTGGGYVVDAPVDAVEFEGLQAEGSPASAATVARTSTAALALWRGPAYAGIGRPFARDEATRLEELRRRCVERLADAELALGRPNRVVAELSELVAADPTRERAAAQLMLALHAADRQADALAVYRRVRATLVEELGVEPGPALRAAEARVLGGPGDLRKHEAPHRSAGDAARLPAAISSFVGRAHDLARVGALLRAHPLTTLTGPGGTGKTRLAIEVARRAATDAVFVDLARTAAPFETTVAEAFGIRFDAGDLVDVVAAALADKPTVVVLDNCEHLLDPCATFAAGLLARAPDLRVLATSRERLGVPGEQVHPVAPLPLPRPHAGWAEITDEPRGAPLRRPRRRHPGRLHGHGRERGRRRRDLPPPRRFAARGGAGRGADVGASAAGAGRPARRRRAARAALPPRGTAAWRPPSPGATTCCPAQSGRCSRSSGSSQATSTWTR